MTGETREETRKRLGNLPEDAFNVGEPEPGERATKGTKEGGDSREWLAGSKDVARGMTKEKR